MILYIADRNIRVDNADNQISYNSDYIAEFVFDEEWDSKIKTARFVQNGEYFDVVLVDDRCEIPPLKTGFVKVGVFSDSMTSTYTDVYFKTSIKDGTGNHAEPPEDVYAQITALIESGILKGADGLTPYIGENGNWWLGNADTGILARGYTPQKGVDYFTEGEVKQIQDEVSSGAIGDFKAVVDSETNKYNNNATEKLNAYNSNVETKIDEYNQNADNRVAEFNTQTEQIQADVSKLKGDLTGLQTVVDSKADASDLAKTSLCLDALYKLNKGQTYDVLEQESEAYSVDVPSGAKYVGIDKVGGKSVVLNQLINGDGHNQNVTFLNGKFTYSNYVSGIWNLNTNLTLISGHKYYAKASKPFNNVYVLCYTNDTAHRLLGVGNVNSDVVVLDTIATCNYTASDYRLYVSRYGATSDTPISNYEGYVTLIDITQMFGAGNEPSIEAFKAMFPDEYYPYSEPTIISSQTDRVDVASTDSTVTQQITTGFPVLNSAGSVYDYIDLNERKLHRRVGVVDLGTLNWVYDSSNLRFGANSQTPSIKACETYKKANALSGVYEIYPTQYILNNKDIDMILGIDTNSNIHVRNLSYTDKTAFKEAMNGVMLYYELAEEIITDITIPTELTDWLTVEAGGSITFHNADDGKRLLIPNKLSFVRKLDEVTV